MHDDYTHTHSVFTFFRVNFYSKEMPLMLTETKKNCNQNSMLFIGLDSNKCYIFHHSNLYNDHLRYIRKLLNHVGLYHIYIYESYDATIKCQKWVEFQTKRVKSN